MTPREKHLSAVVNLSLMSSGVFCVLMGFLRFDMTLPLRTAAAALGFGAISVGIKKSLDDELSIKDFWEGFDREVADPTVNLFSFAVQRSERAVVPLGTILINRANLPAPIAERFQPRYDDCNIAWTDEGAIAYGSKAIFGTKGSGKSVLMAYFAHLMVQHRPDTHLVIVDPHLGLEDGANWFNAQSELCDRYCFKFGKDAVSAKRFEELIDEFQAEMDARIDRISLSKNPWHLMIDEFERIADYLAKHYPAIHGKLMSLVDSIQDEGRKPKFDCTLGMHSIKKINTGLDSDTLAQMLWVACGSAIDNAAAVNVQSILKLPKVREQRQELERKYAGNYCYGTAVIKHPKGCAAVGIPWLDLAQLGYESEPSEEEKAKALLAKRRPEFEQAWVSGCNTHRKLSEALGLRRNAHEAPSIAVQLFLDEMAAPHTTLPDPV
jgi:Helicase HerA, central domain